MTPERSVKDSELSILIVDDNPHYADLLRRILDKGLGYKNIRVMNNTEEAHNAIKQEPNRYRMLFIDFNFPSGMNGGELLGILARSKFLDDKVAFLITSDLTDDNVQRAQKAGAIGVISKPFDREEIARQISIAQRDAELDQEESF